MIWSCINSLAAEI